MVDRRDDLDTSSDSYISPLSVRIKKLVLFQLFTVKIDFENSDISSDISDICQFFSDIFSDISISNPWDLCP